MLDSGQNYIKRQHFKIGEAAFYKITKRLYTI